MFDLGTIPFDFRYIHDCNGLLDVCDGDDNLYLWFWVFSHRVWSDNSRILVTGPKLFNFAYGYVLVMMGLGWTVGAPAAGRFFSVFVQRMAPFFGSFSPNADFFRYD